MRVRCSKQRRTLAGCRPPDPPPNLAGLPPPRLPTRGLPPPRLLVLFQATSLHMPPKEGSWRQANPYLVQSTHRGPTLRFHGDFDGPLWILGSGPESTIPEAEIMAPILTFWPPRSGVRASILYGAPYGLAAAVPCAVLTGPIACSKQSVACPGCGVAAPSRPFPPPAPTSRRGCERGL